MENRQQRAQDQNNREGMESSFFDPVYSTYRNIDPENPRGVNTFTTLQCTPLPPPYAIRGPVLNNQNQIVYVTRADSPRLEYSRACSIYGIVIALLFMFTSLSTFFYFVYFE